MDSLQEISDSNVQEILFDKKSSSKKSRKSDKLTTSSAQESGSVSLGEARRIIPTPPDAIALVLELQGIRKVLGVIQTQAQPEIFW